MTSQSGDGGKESSQKLTEAYAREQDAQDPLRELRGQFEIPTKQQLKRTSLQDEDGTLG
jgi:hypothetical protein